MNISIFDNPSPGTSVGSVRDLRTEGGGVADPRPGSVSCFPEIDASLCGLERILCRVSGKENSWKAWMDALAAAM